MFGNVDKVIVGVIIISTTFDYVSGGLYPHNLENSTTCDEFSQFARFNPYSVLGIEWFVFYYWAPLMGKTEFVFQYPTPKEKMYLHYILDEHVSVPINWTAKFVVMKNTISNESSLLVETGDRGQYLQYPFLKVIKKRGQKIFPREVRIKQTGDNRYIGFMNCERETLLLMSRKTHIPRKKYIQEAASIFGFRGRSPKSYLYQGHEWMPIPEDDEPAFWTSLEEHERELKRLDSMLERDKNGNYIYY